MSTDRQDRIAKLRALADSTRHPAEAAAFRAKADMLTAADRAARGTGRKPRGFDAQDCGCGCGF